MTILEISTLGPLELHLGIPMKNFCAVLEP